MPRTDHPRGTPAGLDHTGPDPESAARFYAALLGWPHPPAGVTLHRAPGPAPAGAAGWTVAFTTPDAHATARSVHGAGGTVRTCGPDARGRPTALCTDPAGALFTVRQSGAPFRLAWTELHTPDPAAARRFYRAVFAWQQYDLRAEREGCTVLRPAGGTPEDGHGAIVQLPAAEAAAGVRPHWLPYFEVLDAEAAADRAVRLGGAVRQPARPVPGLGLLARLTDPCGAAFAVIAADRRTP
ncbi:VOC family protein [Kitasatospora sp. NPDC059571]|uniref:VOC family protein n=1 Tax=Kitasatospora sp. NPDC059571 TaxID=3346871 RepID=UPI00369FF666